MILSTFNKLISKNKGSVEIIESTFLYPVIFIFICSLFIFSTRLIKNGILNEKTFLKSRYLLNNINDDSNINLENLAIRYNIKDIKLETKNRIFKSVIIAKNNNKEFLNTERIKFPEINRILRFVNYVFQDLKEVKIGGYSISKIVDDIKNNINILKEN